MAINNTLASVLSNLGFYTVCSEAVDSKQFPYVGEFTMPASLNGNAARYESIMTDWFKTADGVGNIIPSSGSGKVAFFYNDEFLQSYGRYLNLDADIAADVEKHMTAKRAEDQRAPVEDPLRKALKHMLENLNRPGEEERIIIRSKKIIWLVDDITTNELDWNSWILGCFAAAGFSAKQDESGAIIKLNGKEPDSAGKFTNQQKRFTTEYFDLITFGSKHEHYEKLHLHSCMARSSEAIPLP